MKFCGECGFALTARPAAAAAPASVAEPAAPATDHGPTSERRLVTALFADLVGFTAISENRDPEEVREFLSRYFDTSRRLVELYGGTVEKYIGDAVVAFWGAVAAKEDDAERAVRAGLDLVEAVAALGDEAGLPNLQARAGVLTGEAAVTVGGVSEGLVHGDVVNTASRLQALAPPGSVLAGDSTKRLSDAAIVYEDFGQQEVKGREEPVQAWRALRVVAARRGAQRTTGLEPPFVGRDRELRNLKELFHATLEDGRAQLVSVTGIAGIGKSRLAWEFFKYIDGVTEQVRWHSGRCLAYGEGVTYWALAEMVRTRIGIVEGEVGEVAAEKLRQVMVEAIPDEEERRWLEPRIAQLVGLGEAVSSDRQDLFAAWRRFYERLSEQMPTVMVFEDMQWADPSLVDFIEYLLDWSRNYRLFIVTLGRGGESDPARSRGHTAIHLEPLSRNSMESLITAVVPGLPDELRTRILDQAQGVPLYAVETIRMLIDRGLLAPEGAVYRMVGEIGALDVPQTLVTLIAARLDGLTPEERRLVQDAAVLGKTFTAAGLEAVTGWPAADIQQALQNLVRREVLTVEASQTSPERGQYGFLQDLVRQVAYETLGRRERRELHLKVAAFLAQTFAEDEDEVVEVLASHYVEAYRAATDAPDAEAIKAKARDMLLGAGRRASALGAAEEAQGYYEKAVELFDSEDQRAELIDRIGQMAWQRGLTDVARARYEEAIAAFESIEDARGAALAEMHLADVERAEGKLHEGIARLEKALPVISEEGADATTATVAAGLGRLLTLAGENERAAPVLELALTQAEEQELPEVFSEALNTKAMLLQNSGRINEALVLLRAALAVALENDLSKAALRAYNNTMVAMVFSDRVEDVVELQRQALDLARRIGNRQQEVTFLVGVVQPLVLTGRWGEALETVHRAEEIAGPTLMSTQWMQAEVAWLSIVDVARGDAAGALERFPEAALQHEQAELRPSVAALKAHILNALDRHREALELTAPYVLEEDMAPQSWGFKLCWSEATKAALALGDGDMQSHLLAKAHAIKRGMLTPYLRGQIMRFEARRAAAEGASGQAESGFKSAAAVLREGAFPFHLAVCLTELAELQRSGGREQEALESSQEAQALFQRLGATRWLERLGAPPLETRQPSGDLETSQA